MEFEYDENKRNQNEEKHGVDLLYGALIFEGPTVEAADTRNDYGENRIIAIGYADGLCLVTVYVKRGNVIRLISTRKGGRRDRRKYEEAINRRGEGA
ncbi:BrnT family toxin [Cereibacter johrii]|uniref:BrnT family toxin n=1 Tax=Cereibacter johrii TaxID=445629 RepID=UPI002B1EDAA7|nr:BrnT family toxin [Cereibacter johrii]MEA5163494.1 BrnT family toxin [Cereibacter johrii]